MLSVHRYWWDLPQSERDAYLENSSAAATRLDAEDVAHCADAEDEDAQAIEIDHPTADLFRYARSLAHSLVALISEAHVGRRNGGMAVVAQVTFAILSHSRRDAGRKATDSLDDIKVPHTLTHSHKFTRLV
jgi:hypothetical protein